MSDQFSRKGGFPRNPARERFLFVMAAGAALSLLLVVLTIVVFKPAPQEKPADTAPVVAAAPAAPGTVDLFVPERPVRAGSKLSDVKFKKVVWPSNQVPEGAIRDLADLKDKFAKVPLDPSIPVRVDFISTDAVKVSLPLTPGMRAITIEVDETQALEGYALPGTKVDITLTYMVEKQLSTRVLVQNARVLSFGGDTAEAGQRTTGQLRVTQARTITLEVSPEDALSIQTAKQLGRMGLIMRTADDDKAPDVDSVNQGQITDPSGKATKNDTRCQSGTMRIDGKEFIIPCDGKGAPIPVEGK